MSELDKGLIRIVNKRVNWEAYREGNICGNIYYATQELCTQPLIMACGLKKGHEGLHFYSSLRWDDNAGHPMEMFLQEQEPERAEYAIHLDLQFSSIDPPKTMRAFEKELTILLKNLDMSSTYYRADLKG